MSDKLRQYLKKIFSLNTLFFVILTVLLIVEIKYFTAWRNELTPQNGIFTFLSVQLLIAILPLLFVKTRTIVGNLKPSTNLIQAVVFGILAVFALVHCFNLSAVLINKMELKASNGDIIPQIQRFNREFSAGRFPYTPFDDFGYRMSPTYLPAQWLPYLPSHVLKFDPRFLTFGVFCCAYLVFLVHIVRQNLPFLKALILLAFPIFLTVAVVEFDPNIIAVTVETLILSYYLLLSISLTTHSRAFQILAFVLCLMSRFSLVLWLPLYLFILWTKEGFRPVLRFSLWIFAGCALIYAPFLSIDPYIFSNAQTYYDNATAAAWTYTPDSNHLNHGYSFVNYYLKKGGDIARNIADMKKVMLLATAAVSIVLAAIWWRVKDKLDSRLFSLCALKMSLAVFYSLLQFPFTYLYVTPIILSLGVLYRFTMLQKTATAN
jgi:hypothetical protein